MLISLKVAHLQSYIGPRISTLRRYRSANAVVVSNASSSSTVPVATTTTSNNSYDAIAPPPATTRRLNRHRRKRNRQPVPNARIPNSLATNLRILLTTLRCYCSRRGRSNAATLGRLGAVNLLLRALSILCGVSQSGKTSAMPINSTTASSMSDDDTIEVDPTVIDKCDGRGLVGKTGKAETMGVSVITNAPTLQQMLSTLVVLMKWRKSNIFFTRNISKNMKKC